MDGKTEGNGYVRKSNAQVIADYLMYLHKKVEDAIELNQETSEDMEIVLDVVKDEVDEVLEVINKMEEKENE